jgi:histidinol dehydrogenase
MSPGIRFVGCIQDLSTSDRRALLDRTVRADDTLAQRVAQIIADVRTRGDDALRELARAYDGVTLDSLEVPRARMTHAVDRLSPDLRRALERARDNIASVHRAFAPTCMETEPEPGIVVGRRPDPLRRVGVYAPGGRASYPSSVLMGAVPARVAGVSEIILCSPPDSSGRPSDVVLAAAEIAGVDRVFALGGAGAIAAMAFGTDSVRRVDRIVGPGNAYVATAKAQLAGAVGIDSPAGPSELLVIADASVDTRSVAMELVGQAEHDPAACVVAVLIASSAHAQKLVAELLALTETTPRSETVAAALSRQAAVLVASNAAEAIAFANDYAPEHLWLAVAEPDELFARVRNAGTVFVGREASVAYGDYMSGANHVLPTGGAARAYSGLSPLDFVRWTSYQRFTEDAARSLSDDVAVFALAESLPGHAAAARRWEAAR